MLICIIYQIIIGDIEILEKYNGDHTIRFYECLESYHKGSSFYNHFVTLLNETYSGLSTHVNTCDEHMSPDCVELAAFLIVANNQSWFSYSKGWTVEDPWYQIEFNYSLGPPLNDAKCVNDNEWHIFQDINNLAYSDTIAGGNSSDGTIIYIGKFDEYQECLDTVKINQNYGGFNWINGDNGEWSNMCYGVIGDKWINAPKKNVVSGHLGNLVCTRQFECASVQFDILNQGANITWSKL